MPSSKHGISLPGVCRSLNNPAGHHTCPQQYGHPYSKSGRPPWRKVGIIQQIGGSGIIFCLQNRDRGQEFIGHLCVAWHVRHCPAFLRSGHIKSEQHGQVQSVQQAAPLLEHKVNEEWNSSPVLCRSQIGKWASDVLLVVQSPSLTSSYNYQCMTFTAYSALAPLQI